jgi:hypothetical protein
MPEVTIKYKKPETLKILKELAKFLDFKIAPDNTKEQPVLINGVTMLPAKDNIDPSDLTELFSSKNIDAAELRKRAWQRKK